MYLLNGLKINIQGSVIGPDGTHYPPCWFTDPDARAEVGVVEEPDPIYPDDDLYTYVENEDGSLTITDRSTEEVAERLASRMAFIKQQIIDATQSHLDAFARTRGYDGILSACSYAASAVPKFAAEGQYALGARDNTWATLYGGFVEVEAGTRPMPTGFADVEPFLPVLVWPT
jgi:hypothetical protein